MENSENNNTDNSEIIELLVSSGYDEKLVKQALLKTSSRDFDVLIDMITKIESEEMHAKVNHIEKADRNISTKESASLLKENNEKILADRIYRDKLIAQYREEKEIRRREEMLREEDLRSEEKVVQVKSDCVFQVRFPDAKSVKLYFTKDDTLEDLFDKVAAAYGSSAFTIYKLRDKNPLVRSNIRLKECSNIYPKAVLIVE